MLVLVDYVRIKCRRRRIRGAVSIVVADLSTLPAAAAVAEADNRTMMAKLN